MRSARTNAPARLPVDRHRDDGAPRPPPRRAREQPRESSSRRPRAAPACRRRPCAVDDRLDAEPARLVKRRQATSSAPSRASIRGDRAARSGARSRPRPSPRAGRSRARSTPSARNDVARPASRPSVTVPVLSSTIVVTRRVCSRTSGPLIRMPSWAPRPVPTISAVGVARPRAHGQAMISTATAAVNAADASPVSSEPADERGERDRRSRPARRRRRRGRRAAGSAPCPPAPPRRDGRSARARCRRRPSSPRRRGGPTC